MKFTHGLLIAGLMALSFNLKADEDIKAGVVRLTNTNNTNALYGETIVVQQQDGKFSFFEGIYQYGYELTLTDGKLIDSTGAEIGSVTDTGYSFTGVLSYDDNGTTVNCTDAYTVENADNAASYLNDFACDNGFTEKIKGKIHGYDGDDAIGGAKVKVKKHFNNAIFKAKLRK